MHSVLVLDDLPEARAMLRQAIAEAFPMAHTTCTQSLQEARQAIQDQAFDLALIDLGLGDGQGHELISVLAHSQPKCAVVVATIYDDDDNLFQALKAGAQGYLLKDQGQSWLVRQLQGIAEGRPPLSPAIARRLLRHFQSPANTQSSQPTLTARERDVLGLLAQGVNIVDIGTALGISRHTVGDHVKNLYRKLNISSRAEAALRARGMGLA
jgi:DNA-binding NarL/FixJ family response regulator